MAAFNRTTDQSTAVPQLHRDAETVIVKVPADQAGLLQSKNLNRTDSLLRIEDPSVNLNLALSYGDIGVAHLIGENSHEYHFSTVINVPPAVALERFWSELITPYNHEILKVTHPSDPALDNVAYVDIKITPGSYVMPYFIPSVQAGRVPKEKLGCTVARLERIQNMILMRCQNN